MIFLKEDWKSLPWMLEWFRATPGFYRSGIDTDLIWQCKQTAWSKEGRNPPLYWCATLDKNSWPRSQAYLKYTLSRIGKKNLSKTRGWSKLDVKPPHLVLRAAKVTIYRKGSRYIHRYTVSSIQMDKQRLWEACDQFHNYCRHRASYSVVNRLHVCLFRK